MAKQVGVIGFRGKIKNQSYYSSKNGGELVRTINEGMSARVKTAQEYANTRKNNSEFGMCGDFAGAIIKPISLRWRFILDSIATGKMVKSLKEIVKLDATGKWGERVVGDSYNDAILNAFNSFSKNEAPSDLVSALSTNLKYDSTAQKVFNVDAINLSADEVNRLMALGANGATGISYVYSIVKPQYDAQTGVYTKAETKMEELTYIEGLGDFVSGHSSMLFDVDGEQAININPTAANAVSGILTIILPYRNVGGASNTLQQLCYACWTPITTGTAPEP